MACRDLCWGWLLFSFCASCAVLPGVVRWACQPSVCGLTARRADSTNVTLFQRCWRREGVGCCGCTHPAPSRVLDQVLTIAAAVPSLCISLVLLLCCFCPCRLRSAGPDNRRGCPGLSGQVWRELLSCSLSCCCVMARCISNVLLSSPRGLSRACALRVSVSSIDLRQQAQL